MGRWLRVQGGFVNVWQQGSSRGVKGPSTKSGIGSWNVTIYMDLHSSLATLKTLEIHINFLSQLSKLHNGAKRFGYQKHPHI